MTFSRWGYRFRGNRIWKFVEHLTSVFIVLFETDYLGTEGVVERTSFDDFAGVSCERVQEFTVYNMLQLRL